MLDQRIDEHAVLAQAVIEMRTGGVSRGTDPADERTLIYMSPGTNAGGKRGQVQVVTLEPAGMPQAHHVATAAAPSRRDNRSCRHSDHRCPDGRAVVNSEVRAVGSIDRVEPAARKTRRNARFKSERCA